MSTSAGWQPWRLGVFYAAYYSFAGVLGTYFPLYLEARGLAAAEIGVVMALGQAMRVVGPTAWGWLADHTSHRLAILRSTALAAFLAFLPILLPGGIGLVFSVMLAFQLCVTAQVPVSEAIAAMNLRGDPQAAERYGRLRAGGSLGFIVAVLITGALLDDAGVAPTPYVILGLLAVTLASTLLVRDASAGEAPHERVSVRSRLAEPRVRWFFLSVLLMIFAHSAMYTYFSIYLAGLGYSKTQIGVFWVLGVIIEVALFLLQGRLFRRFELLHL